MASATASVANDAIDELAIGGFVRGASVVVATVVVVTHTASVLTLVGTSLMTTCNCCFGGCCCGQALGPLSLVQTNGAGGTQHTVASLQPGACGVASMLHSTVSSH